LRDSALNEQGGGASLRQAGKNSFPQTPFLFARPLDCPLRGRGGYKKSGSIN